MTRLNYQTQQHNVKTLREFEELQQQQQANLRIVSKLSQNHPRPTDTLDSSHLVVFAANPSTSTTQTRAAQAVGSQPGARGHAPCARRGHGGALAALLCFLLGVCLALASVGRSLEYPRQQGRASWGASSGDVVQPNSNDGGGGGGGYLGVAAEPTSTPERPVVYTTRGFVRGITQKTPSGKFVDAFLGVPFARPPTGALRFMHPQPMPAWSGEWDASRMSSSCYQLNDTAFGPNFAGTSVWNANTPLSEDCLYLNVWVPFGVARVHFNGHNTSSSGSGSTGSGHAHARDPNSARNQRAVLVWIYGGGFTTGTASLGLYEGGILASEEDVLVVSMNYRVAALGFLYVAGRSEAPGNAGLFDQLMALQWVADNIGEFGGDPSRVTIFGESAGATSVALHLLSPLSRPLFTSAIMQSGAATNPWGLKDARELTTNSIQLASLVGCPSMSVGDINELNGLADITTELGDHDKAAAIECLLRVEPIELVRHEVGQTKTILKFPFVPVVDNNFLVQDPIESLTKLNFKRAPVMLGSNQDEGNFWLIYLSEVNGCPAEGSITSAPDYNTTAVDNSQSKTTTTTTIRQVQGGPSESNSTTTTIGAALGAASKWCKPLDNNTMTRDEFYKLLREELNPYLRHPVAREAIVFEYTNWINLLEPSSNYDALDKIVGDYYFSCPCNELAARYAQAGQPVFMYHYRHRSSLSPWPKWMGVLHGDEINFVFGEPLNVMLNYTAREVELSKRMMKYWANFARFGNPVKLDHNGLTMDDQWPEYSDKHKYFELSTGPTKRIGHGPRTRQCAFWLHYLPRLLSTLDRTAGCSARESSRLRSIYPAYNARNIASVFEAPQAPNGPTASSSEHLDQSECLESDPSSLASPLSPLKTRPSNSMKASSLFSPSTHKRFSTIRFWLYALASLLVSSSILATVFILARRKFRWKLGHASGASGSGQPQAASPGDAATTTPNNANETTTTNNSANTNNPIT